jgi:hypothetical protein
MSGSFISKVELRDYLNKAEPTFDTMVELYQRPGYDNGYHTRLTSRDMTHPTRDNFDFAIALLLTEDEHDRERAIRILRKLLPLQDKVSTHPTYGVWPWFWEEPLEKMNPPDWNWADFCGLRIAQILRRHTEGLPADLVVDLRAALDRAAWSIYRRNVQTTYSNISIMGAYVCLTAAELLNDERLGEYGRTRLQDMLRDLKSCDGFAEYNSPNYTLEILNICERALFILEAPEHVQPVEELRQRVWGLIADFFHPVMAQWGGPQLRAYQTWLESHQLEYLSQRIGFSLVVREGVEPREGAILGGPAFYPKLPCPPELTSRFRELPEGRMEIRKSFLPPTAPRPKLIGTSFMTPKMALGSANRALMWVQTRAVLGYLKTEEDPAVQFRLRFLHNGRDFSSAFNFNDQKGPHILTAMGLILDGGSFHPSLNKPANSIFEANDLRMRFELLGRGVSAEINGAGFELKAGTFRIEILPGISVFNGEKVAWEIVDVVDGWAVDAICHAGPKRAFPFKEIGRTLLCAGVSVLEGGALAPLAGPRIEKEFGDTAEIGWKVGWDNLRLKAWHKPRAENP